MKKALIASALIAITAFSAYAQARSQCMGITKSGARCQNLAKPGSSYCHLHGG